MINENYKRIIQEKYKQNEEISFLDFINICDELKLLVVEHEKVINPFVKPHEKIKYKTFKSMSEYRNVMPFCSARNYDYEGDRATYYLSYPGINEGNFYVTYDTSSSSYIWYFEIVGEFVIVHSIFQFVD